MATKTLRSVNLGGITWHEVVHSDGVSYLQCRLESMSQGDLPHFLEEDKYHRAVYKAAVKVGIFKEEIES